MSIAEIVNERGEVTRIDFWNDNKVRVVQSHTYSVLYMLKYQLIKKDKPNLSPDEISRRTNIYLSVYHNGVQK
jgi:hypothetical protein